MQEKKKDTEELVDRGILVYTCVLVLLVQAYYPAATELHVLFSTGSLLVMQIIFCKKWFANDF